ncbi:sulfite exporter TauE/SafE family protein [Helicobacter canis]|uniref:sulfite exporter TauE/SafE family protein n=1 Tax=Helicobacter canis TaxID=29419 RepID=UPI0026F332DC|nr:sulfite exporter TauE/SafE family protein [Helicobacter canis]
MLTLLFSYFDWWQILGFIALGLVSGVAAGFFGIGGGVIIVPCMLLVGFPIQHAIGISIVQMIFASVFGSLLNYKKGLLDLREGVFIGIGGVFGASLSGVVLHFCSELLLSLAFLLLTAISLYRFATKSKVAQSLSPITNPYKKRAILVLAGAFTGIFAISLGIGGGLLIAPILGYYLGYDSKKVVPLSLFFVVFSSAAGSLSLYQMDIVDSRLFGAAILIGLASIIGVSIGIKLITKASANTHRVALLWIYCFAIIATSIKIFEKALL